MLRRAIPVVLVLARIDGSESVFLSFTVVSKLSEMDAARRGGGRDLVYMLNVPVCVVCVVGR